MKRETDTGTKQLVAAFRAFLAGAATTDRPVAGPARFALETVDWRAASVARQPKRHPVADRWLERAVALSGAQGSQAHAIAQALLAARERIEWHVEYADRAGEPDMAALSRNYTATAIVGRRGLLTSDRIAAGFSLQAPDTYYPPHAHDAEESYWIVGGNGDWRVDAAPWFAVGPGDSIHHPPRARHAMQTNTEPMLALWLWTSDLDSEVLILRS